MIDFAAVRLPASSPIERIWFARGEGGGRETILPDGRFELIFNFGDPVLQDGVAQPRAMLSAETRRAVTIESTGRADFLGLTLRDGRASSVIDAPPREVRDRMVEMHRHLYERLAEATDEQRTGIVMHAFRDSGADPLAEYAAAAIRRAHGRLSISRLARACGVSIRTLNRAGPSPASRPSRWIELPPGLGVQFLQDGRDASR